MRRRSLKVLAVMIGLAMLAAACGDDDDSTAEEPAADEPAADEPAADEPAADEPAADEPAADDELVILSDPDSGVTDDTIKVGWLGDITGPTASAQAFNFHGSDAFYECANAEGGVLGHQYEFIAEDDQYNAEISAVAFDKLVKDEKVLALVDFGGSGQITQAIDEINNAGIPVIGPGQTIDVQLDSPYIFSNIAHYGDQADIAVGQMAAELGGAENAVVMSLVLEVPSGQEYADYIQQSVTQAGGTYAGTLLIPLTATELTAQMVDLQTAIDEQGVNYLALHGAPAHAQLALQSLADTGLTDLPVIGIHGVSANSVFENSPPEVTSHTWGVHTFMPSNNDIEAAADMTRCAELAGYSGEDLTNNFAHGYLNALILDEAIRRAAEANDGVVNRETVTEALGAAPFDTQGISCTIDWTTTQNSPCGAPFQLDPATGGMVPANPFDFYSDTLDGVYGIGA